MDFTTIIGVSIGVAAIFLGNLLEGGHFSALIQFTAFIIVFGGTLGATIVSNTKEGLNRSIDLFKATLKKDDETRFKKAANQIVDAATIVRKEGPLALEKKIHSFDDPFMQAAFRFSLDGVDAKQVEEVFYNRIDVEDLNGQSGAKVWMDAAGFAPTIGIIGAVLGLIHVMGNLSDTTQLGKGIAVAFVATIYGVGSSNLVFLPIGNKIKAKLKNRKLFQEMIVAGVVEVSKGSNAHVVSVKMQNYISSSRFR